MDSDNDDESAWALSDEGWQVLLASAVIAVDEFSDEVVIGPILAGVRVPRQGRPPKAWTCIDRDYEALRVGMQTLFGDLGLSTSAPTAA